MKNIKVSVIVPIFNAQEYLSTCIESILHQTLKEIEIILVDDGSTDKSLEICKKYAMQDERIQVFTQSNGGVSSARNKGLEVAHGEYIGFVDADDWIEKEMYEEMYKQGKELGTEVVVCNYVEQENWQQDKWQHHIKKEVLQSEEEKEEFICSLLAGEDLTGKGWRNFFKGPCVYLYQGALVKSANKGFIRELLIGEDFVFNLQVLSKANKIGINQGCYYYYRRNIQSATQIYRPNLEQEHKILLEKVEMLLEGKRLSKESKKRVANMRVAYLIKNVVNECHKNNKKCYRDKIKAIKQMCRESITNETIRVCNTEELSLSRRIWFMLYKLKCSRILYFYYRYIAE